MFFRVICDSTEITSSILFVGGHWQDISSLHMSLHSGTFIQSHAICTGKKSNWSIQDRKHPSGRVILFMIHLLQDRDLNSVKLRFSFDWLRQVRDHIVTHSFKPALPKFKTASRMHRYIQSLTSGNKPRRCAWTVVDAISLSYKVRIR